jgi:hypothetical protein
MQRFLRRQVVHFIFSVGAADPMLEARTYSAPFDVTTRHSRSYLRNRLRLFYGNKLRNPRLCPVPMFERDTGEYIFDLFRTPYDVLHSEWKGKIMAVLTDGTANMIGGDRGAVSRIEAVAAPVSGEHGVDSTSLTLSCNTASLASMMQHSIVNSLHSMGTSKDSKTSCKDDAKCPEVASTRLLSLGK